MFFNLSTHTDTKKLWVETLWVVFFGNFPLIMHLNVAATLKTNKMSMAIIVHNCTVARHENRLSTCSSRYPPRSLITYIFIYYY